jgi:hypothetical protein
MTGNPGVAVQCPHCGARTGALHDGDKRCTFCEGDLSAVYQARVAFLENREAVIRARKAIPRPPSAAELDE